MNNVTDHQKERFFEVLADTLNVTAASKAAKFDRSTAYEYKKNNPDFKAKWEEVFESALDDLEMTTITRAKDSSDTLAIFLLKTRRREIYGQDRASEQNPPPVVNVITHNDDGKLHVSAEIWRAVAEKAATLALDGDDKARRWLTEIDRLMHRQRATPPSELDDMVNEMLKW